MLTEAKNTVSETAESAKNIVVKRTMSIWQKFLLYPAVFAALFGAIPTTLDLYNAYKYDIRYSNVKHAEEQRALWEKNFACTSTLLYQKVRTEKNTEVQVGACDNGDILISILQPNGEKVVEWVAIDKLGQTASASSFLFSKAFAANFTPQRIKTNYSRRRNPNIHLAANQVETMCQELIKAEAKIFRIVKEEGICYGEVVEMMKGKVSLRKMLPCDTQCKTFDRSKLKQTK